MQWRPRDDASCVSLAMMMMMMMFLCFIKKVLCFGHSCSLCTSYFAFRSILVHTRTLTGPYPCSHMMTFRPDLFTGKDRYAVIFCKGFIVANYFK